MKKRAPKTFFSDFRLPFEVIFGALFGNFDDVGATDFWEGVRDRFVTVFGSILEVFCTDFWYNSGGVFYEKRGFTCMGAHFSKVSLYFVVSLLLAGISEIAVLPAWELSFHEFA